MREFARTLERELAAVTAEVIQARKAWIGDDHGHLPLIDAMQKVRQELDRQNAELTDENTRLRVEVEKLKEEVAFRLGQAREAIASRDRYRCQAERKRLLAREFESVLGFTEYEARQEGAIEEAVRRIKAMKANQCEEEPVAWMMPEGWGYNRSTTVRHEYGDPLYRKAKL